MNKIIERIVESEGAPNANDLWLTTGEEPEIKRLRNGEWVSVAGGGAGQPGPQGEKGEKGDKGDKGDTGATGPQGPKGDQGNSGYTGAAGELEVVNNLTDGGAAKALSAEMGKTINGEVTQLEAKVDDLNGYTKDESDVPSTASFFWVDNAGVIGTSASGMGLHRADPIPIVKGEIITLTTTVGATTANAGFLCDDSGNILQTFAKDDATTTATFTVPAGATKLYINWLTTFSVQNSGLLAVKQDKLTFDDAPTQNSSNPAKSGGIYNSINGAIDNYQEQYGAREIADNTDPMPLSEDDFVLGNLDNSGNEVATRNIIRSDFIEVIPGTGFTFSTSNGYRANLYCFNAQNTFVRGYGWQTGTYRNFLADNTAYIRIVIASPSGVTTAPVWEDAAFSLVLSKAYKPTRAAAESEVEKVMNNYFNLELPILSSSPQLPADGEAGSDFNAETMTSMEIQSAIESQIDKLSVPNVGVNPYTPKYGTIYETIGKDASGLYDIKAYVFTRRNRFA